MIRASDPSGYDGVRALVLGATGFIGRRVTSALTARAAHVVAAGRDAHALDALRSEAVALIDVARCDVLRDDDVAHLIEETQPDIVFNLAGYGVDRSEVDEAIAHRINGELPLLLALQLERARARGSSEGRLVHVGSALEYGAARGDLSEDHTEEPTTWYGSSKLAGTMALAEHAQRAGVRALTARLFTVYGPGEHAGRLLPALLETARTGTPLALTAGTQRRDFTFVDDVADGLLRLGTSAATPGAVVNLATGRLESVRGFATRAARVLGIDASLLRFGSVPTRAHEMAHEPVTIARLRALTGWAPQTSIEEGVRRTISELHPERVDGR